MCHEKGKEGNRLNILGSLNLCSIHRLTYNAKYYNNMMRSKCKIQDIGDITVSQVSNLSISRFLVSENDT